MYGSQTLRYFPYLASGLSDNFGFGGQQWIKFLNPVNYVKFVRLSALKMNGDGVTFTVAHVFPFGRRVH